MAAPDVMRAAVDRSAVARRGARVVMLMNGVMRRSVAAVMVMAGAAPLDMGVGVGVGVGVVMRRWVAHMPPRCGR